MHDRVVSVCELKEFYESKEETTEALNFVVEKFKRKNSVDQVKTSNNNNKIYLVNKNKRK